MNKIHKDHKIKKQIRYKVDYIRIKKFCATNGTMKKVERQHRMVEKIYKLYI